MCGAITASYTNNHRHSNTVNGNTETIQHHRANRCTLPKQSTDEKLVTPASPDSDNDNKNNREDTLGPLQSELINRRETSVLSGVTSLKSYSNPDLPCTAHRAQQAMSMGRTPPVTPPGRCGSPGSPRSSSGSPHAKVAPTSVRRREKGELVCIHNEN